MVGNARLPRLPEMPLSLGINSGKCVVELFVNYFTATLVLYCKEVAARAPKTPFYYYNIPIMSGVSCKYYHTLPVQIKYLYKM